MKILVFGDSITQGFFDDEMGGWCNRLAVHTMQDTLKTDFEKDTPIFNLGISGDCTSRLLERFGAEVEARTKKGVRESVIVFAVGVNDTQRYVADGRIRTTEEQFKSNLKELYTQAKGYTDKVVFIGLLPIIESMVSPMPWANDRGHQWEDVQQYDQFIKEFCAGEDCLYIPMNDVFGDDPQLKLIDGIHPNVEGHKLIFERVKEELERNSLL